MEAPGNKCTEAMALTLFSRLQDEFAAGNIKRKKLVWMELTSCSGNIISLLNEEYPDFPFLITDKVEFVYNNSLIVKEGGRR
jgi:hydrogenase small subunit